MVKVEYKLEHTSSVPVIKTYQYKFSMVDMICPQI